MVSPTAWKVSTLVELTVIPSDMAVVLLLLKATPLSLQLTVGSGYQANVIHWNSTCWSCLTDRFAPVMLTVPLSDIERERQRRV